MLLLEKIRRPESKDTEKPHASSEDLAKLAVIRATRPTYEEASAKSLVRTAGLEAAEQSGVVDASESFRVREQIQAQAVEPTKPR